MLLQQGITTVKLAPSNPGQWYIDLDTAIQKPLQGQKSHLQGQKSHLHGQISPLQGQKSGISFNDYKLQVKLKCQVLIYVFPRKVFCSH